MIKEALKKIEYEIDYLTHRLDNGEVHDKHLRRKIEKLRKMFEEICGYIRRM
jgi:hypothetical protein